jgi:hypothetical protein
MSAAEKSNEVKKLALEGGLDDIESKFGVKARLKAKSYAEAKLADLREKKKLGESLSDDKYATKFMLFALDSYEDDIDKLVASFTGAQTSQAGSDDLNVSFAAVIKS